MPGGGNRGLYRLSGPQQPGGFPWLSKLHGAGTFAQRPAACNALLGYYWFATDVSSFYQCQLSAGTPAWVTVAQNNINLIGGGPLLASGGGTGQSGCLSGDLLYGSATNIWSRLTGNNGTRQFLSMAGNVPAWNALAAADYPVFIAAGGSHAAGAVPDPGATAHTNQPRVLGDGAAWVKHSGKFLGKSRVLTDQSTPSTTAVDLATADTVTFTVDESTDVVIDWIAEYYCTSAGAILADSFVITGTGAPAPGVSRQPYCPGANDPLSVSMREILTFPAGTYTVKVQHLTNVGTAHWRNRVLTCQIYG